MRMRDIRQNLSQKVVKNSNWRYCGTGSGMTPKQRTRLPNHFDNQLSPIGDKDRPLFSLVGVLVQKSVI